ncbi:MAG: hypothetical protein M1450_05055 [Patescibacteria group bacterium]|nr:hypothetical protein [Patescibacteria group bacterium]
MDNEINSENNLVEQASVFSNLKVRLLIAVVPVMLVLLFIIFLFTSSRQTKSPGSGITVTPRENEEASFIRKNSSMNAPRVYFKNYKNNSSPLIIPDTIKTFTLKNNFSTQEVLDFAQKLGFKKYNQTGVKTMVISDIEDLDKRGILSFNKDTGSFYFESYGVLKPVGYVPSQQPILEAELFLKDLGIYDNTISCTNTYQRRDIPVDITYVECHRDWKKTEIPVLNLGGILTLSENEKITDLFVGKIDESSVEDTAISNVKDRAGNILKDYDKKSRPDDFNSVTFGIAKDGRILTVVSNLRFVDKQTVLSSKKDIITPEEALTAFQNHKAQFSLTIPTGTGTVEWKKVYPDNKAISENAVINDISLAFLEKPAGSVQSEYKPYYLIRGTAVLESGYSVKFVEVVSALKTDTALLLKDKEVAGAKTKSNEDGNPNLQLDTFNPESATTTLTPASAPPSPTPTVPSGPPVTCDLQNSIGEINLDVPGYGTLTIVMKNAHTFFLKKETATQDEIKNARRALYKAVQEQYKINVAKWVKANEDYSGLANLKSTLKTVDNVKTFFEGTIDQIYDNTCQQISLDPNNTREAPYVCYYEELFTRKKSPNTLTQEMTNEVAAWFLADLQNIGTSNAKALDEYSAKADLFPDITLQTFHYVFILPRPVDEDHFKCILTAYSPAIFLYPEETTKISVQTGAPLIYSDPSISSNIWNIISSPDGTINQGGIKRNNLYYEYDKSKVVFSEPSTGFIIKTDQWKDFIKNNLSQKLGLNSKETESLIVEIQNSLIGTQRSQYLKLSLIPKSELNKKLPLTINPKPDNIYRINIFIKPLNTYQSIQSPKINQIKRNGFTVVEVGAYSE